MNIKGMGGSVLHGYEVTKGAGQRGENRLWLLWSIKTKKDEGGTVEGEKRGWLL